MSSRVLRKLQSDNKELTEENSDNDTDIPNGGVRRKQLNINRYELLNQLSHSESEVKEDDNETEANKSCEGSDIHECVKRKKKKKKRKTGKSVAAEKSSEDNAEMDEVERSVREVNKILGESIVPKCSSTQQMVGLLKPKFARSKHHQNILNVQHKHLNLNNELKRIFGSKIVQSEQQQHKKKHRSNNRAHVKTTCLVAHKEDWPHLTKGGLSMTLVDSKDGLQCFAYEHSVNYRAVQYRFFDAVESMNPTRIFDIVKEHPYHIDALIHLADICKLSENLAMSAEVIERAVHILECAFHPSFNVYTGLCRLDYKRQENRALYITLFKHLLNVGSRACYRTALEYCKVALSLDPDGDPLAIKLALDFYALRSKEYQWLVDLFNEWEPAMNLSQLPNFAFSIPIAHFYLANNGNSASSSSANVNSANVNSAMSNSANGNRTNNASSKIADVMLQEALLMFPGLLMPLLEMCSVQIDARVSKHDFFGPQTQNKQPQALNQLINLYVHRSHHVWKESELLPWLEKNVHVVLDRVDNKDPLVKEYELKRTVRYQGTLPRSISRHIFLSDIKGVTISPHLEDLSTGIDNFDPLPPLDSINIYKRTKKTKVPQSGSTLGMFFRSLLPNFHDNDLMDNLNLEEEDGARALPLEEQAGGGAPEGDIRMLVVDLVRNLHNLLSNIRPIDVPIEADVDENDDSEEDDPNNYLT